MKRKIRNSYKSCAFCRGMRSFAVSGFGGGLSAYIAIFLERDRGEMMYWIVVGAMLALFLVIKMDKKE